MMRNVAKKHTLSEFMSFDRSDLSFFSVSGRGLIMVAHDHSFPRQIIVGVSNPTNANKKRSRGLVPLVGCVAIMITLLPCLGRELLLVYIVVMLLHLVGEFRRKHCNFDVLQVKIWVGKLDFVGIDDFWENKVRC